MRHLAPGSGGSRYLMFRTQIQGRWQQRWGRSYCNLEITVALNLGVLNFGIETVTSLLTNICKFLDLCLNEERSA